MSDQNEIERGVWANAKAQGLSTYVGKACAMHPGSARYVASKSCVECAKAARRARQADNTAKDRERKRAARAAARNAPMAPLSGSIICEIVGL